jgi:glycosyltransferase involved in cell wall biosynthesis
MPTPVSLYIITFNEAENLRAVLPTVSWADEVVVVDSFSNDDTASVCTQFGVRHVNIKFDGFGKLRNGALALLKHDWVVSIDTDERSTPEFAEEVRRTLVAPQHAADFAIPCFTAGCIQTIASRRCSTAFSFATVKTPCMKVFTAMAASAIAIVSFGSIRGRR